MHTSKLDDFARRLDNKVVQIKVAWRTQNGLQSLQFDHINETTGDNQSSNLRVVDNQQNIALAVGKARQATIHRFDDSNVEGSLDKLIVTGDTSIELAEKLQVAMAQMKYPEKYLQCRRSTVYQWVCTMKPTSALCGKIVIEDVSVDRDGDLDDDDDGSLNHRRLWWYVATFQDKDGMFEYQAYRGKEKMVSALKDRLKLPQSVEYLNEYVFRGLMNEFDEGLRKSRVNEIAPGKLVDLYSSHHLVKFFATYDLTIGDSVSKSCMGYRGIVDELEKDKDIFKSIKECLQDCKDADEETIRINVRGQLGTFVKTYLRDRKLYGESNVRGTLARFGIKITPSGDPVANTNTDSGQAHRVTFEDGQEKLLTCIQILDMLRDRQGTKRTSVHDWVANANANGVMHEALQNLGIVKIEKGHGKDSPPKHCGIHTTVRITYPSGDKRMDEEESCASKTDAGSFILGRATLRKKLSVKALLKRMHHNGGEFKDDNSVTFTMQETVENTRKSTVNRVYAIVVRTEICSKGMDLVERHVASWDEQLPEFLLKIQPEHYKVIDQKLAKNHLKMSRVDLLIAVLFV